MNIKINQQQVLNNKLSAKQNLFISSGAMCKRKFKDVKNESKSVCDANENVKWI